MREHVSRQKKTTTGFSIPSLKQPIRGFGLESSAISRQAVPGIQPLHKPVTHDISRIPLRTQAKLSISQPGDKYEQEADSVAQQVMQTMAQPVNRQSIQRETLPEDEEELQMKPLANSITPLVQREALPEDEEELQMKPLDNRTLQREALPEDEEELQMKSLDNSTLQREALPEDEEELQMKSLDNRTLQREALSEDEEELQMKSLDNRTLQRQEVPEDEEELQMKPMVQRQAKAGMVGAPDLEASINQARGGGVAIADNIRKPMEVAFGADFSGVKVHTDNQSDQLNRSIQARAFTTGQDVFFRSGEYNPGSRGGQELLAHELTHVVQQNGGVVQRSQNQKATLQRQETEIIQRVVYDNMAAMWTEVHSGYSQEKIQNILKDSVLSAQYNDAATQLPKCDFVQVQGTAPQATSTPDAEKPYKIEWDTAEKLSLDEDYFASAIIHELAHVASSQQYRRNGVNDRELIWANMNLPPAEGVVDPETGMSPNQLQSYQTQMQTIDRNWQDLEKEATADQKSGKLPNIHYEHIYKRIQYGLGTCFVHNDTVLVDMLYYLKAKELDNTKTYSFARRMLNEANDRRRNGFWSKSDTEVRVVDSKAWWFQFWKW
ncbi:eCIS core domain-containing protein [Nostoc sp. DSM 114159]